MSHIRVSSAGACPRRVQYEAWGIVGLPPWEGTERAFEEGNIHEASILRWAAENLPGAPYVIHDEQKEVSIFYGEREVLKGHIDGLATNNAGETVLVEAKALARRSFEEIRKNGLKQAHPQYFLQVQLYLYGLGMERGYLIARNKETPKTRYWDHHFEEVVFDKEYVEVELERLNELLDKIELNEEIPAPFNPENDWQCLSLDTEVLTRDGWKTYDKVTKDDDILTFNIQLKQPEWQKPCEVFVKDYNGPMYKRNGVNIRFCVTADHNMLVRSAGLPERKHPYKLVKVKELYPNAYYHFVTSGKCETETTCNLPDSLIALSAWITAEGSISDGLVRIAQNDGEQADEIKSYLDNLKLTYHIDKRQNGNNTFLRFTLNKPSSDYVIRYHGEKSKAIPPFVWELDHRQFDLWLNALLRGDGHINDKSRVKEPRGRTWHASLNQRDYWLLDEIQALCAIHGYSTIKGGPYISSTGGKYYALSITKRQERKVKLSTGLEVFDYNGKVWCLTVPNGTIFTRYEGAVVVLGNCRLPWCPYVNICYPEYYEQATKPKRLPKMEDLREIVEEYVELGEEINELSKRRNELKDIILGSVGDRPVIAGKYEVSVKERMSERVDTKAVRELVPAEMLQSLVRVTTSKILEVRELTE